jgi:hypothetical protein
MYERGAVKTSPVGDFSVRVPIKGTNRIRQRSFEQLYRSEVQYKPECAERQQKMRYPRGGLGGERMQLPKGSRMIMWPNGSMVT